MIRNWTDCSGIQSTVKIIFSFGNRITSVAVGVILADVEQFERRAAEIDRPFRVDHLVWHHNVCRLQCLDPRLSVLVRYEHRAQILERLTASNVIEMAVAVD